MMAGGKQAFRLALFTYARDIFDVHTISFASLSMLRQKQYVVLYLVRCGFQY
jgi:hypothetical protein